jgi:hypothetical protein
MQIELTREQAQAVAIILTEVVCGAYDKAEAFRGQRDHGGDLYWTAKAERVAALFQVVQDQL